MSRHKSPLRYPGGKQKLAPFITEVMQESGLIGGDYAEPYAGGAGVAIELLLSGNASHVHLNDSSVAIYSFWRAILNKTDEFCRLISSASLTIEEWRRQKEILSRPKEFDQLEVGFSLFFLNRCNRSGIPSGGVIGGLKQTGKWKIDARFTRNELIRRIETIADKRKKISLKNWDAEKFILEYIPGLPAKSLVYCDPPYYNEGRRLYLDHYRPEDHERIAGVIQRQLKRPWIVSYDAVPEILKFYLKRRSFVYDLQYNAAAAYKGKEVFVFADRIKLPESSALSSIDYALKTADL
jgi:DNA adenine methylase